MEAIVTRVLLRLDHSMHPIGGPKPLRGTGQNSTLSRGDDQLTGRLPVD